MRIWQSLAQLRNQSRHRLVLSCISVPPKSLLTCKTPDNLWNVSSRSAHSGLGILHERTCLNDDPCSQATQDPHPITIDEPTIYALSTAPGRAAIAVIRISGPLCLSIYNSLTGSIRPPKPRHATLKRLHDPTNRSDVLESAALVLYFPASKTVTGEDVLELHIHGGNAVVKAILRAIPRCVSQKSGSSTPTIRYAEPGEFTRRAYWNGRLDLTQIEALADTLSAETEQQRRLAVAGSSALLAQKYDEWRQLLLSARGELEALIDFSEDQHFDDGADVMIRNVTAQVIQLQIYLRANIENAFRGELVRKGFSIAFLGAPNVGKSSLLNRIVQREAAIVSSTAGTTRDVIDVGVDIEGFYCRFGDLAGLRGGSGDGSNAKREQLRKGVTGIREDIEKDDLDPIEQEGMCRAIQRALESDVVIVVLDFVQNPSSSPALRPLNPRLISAIKQVSAADPKRPMLYVLNKADLLSPSQLLTYNPATELDKLLSPYSLKYHPTMQQQDPILISCQPQPPQFSQSSTSGGNNGDRDITIPNLLKCLSSILAQKSHAITGSDSDDIPPSFWDQSLGTSERQRLLLQQCSISLEKFIECVNVGKMGDGISPSSLFLLNENHDEDKAEQGENEFDGGKYCDFAKVKQSKSEHQQSELSDAHEMEIDVVLAAEHLRDAASCLAKITGKGEMGGDVEEVLGVVFDKFCVGK